MTNTMSSPEWNRIWTETYEDYARRIRTMTNQALADLRSNLRHSYNANPAGPTAGAALSAIADEVDYREGRATR